MDRVLDAETVASTNHQITKILHRLRRVGDGEEATGWEGRIWLKSTDGAPTAATKRAGAAKRPARKQPVRKGARRPTTVADEAPGTDVEGGDAARVKTTRPNAAERREPEPAVSAADRIGRRLDAFPDRVDIRDWPYQPRLTALPYHVAHP